MLWRHQESWYATIDRKPPRMIRARVYLIPFSIYPGFQKEQHIGHVSKEPATIDVLDKLQKESIHCDQERVHDSGGDCLKLLCRKEAPAAERSFRIDKTFIV